MKKQFLIISFSFFLLNSCSTWRIPSEQLRATVGPFSILNVDIKLINNGNEPIKDFFVTCATYGTSGTVLDMKSQKIFQTIEPYNQLVVKNINIGFVNSQTVNVNCSASSY